MEDIDDVCLAEPVPNIVQLVPTIEPWVAVCVVEDEREPDGVRLFTRRIACWGLMQRPGDVLRLEGITAQEEEAGETAASCINMDQPVGVLGYAPADEVQDLPADRTDWRELARHWPSMHRAILEQQAHQAHNGARSTLVPA